MTRRSIYLCVIALVVLLAPAVQAQDPAQPSWAALEAKIVRSLAQTIDIGAPMYNAGDQAGCYQLYRGALVAVTPLLDHRPELQRAVRQKLDQAPALRTVPERAFKLREALDEIRATLSKDQAAAVTKEPPKVADTSLWGRLGGEEAVRAVVHDFVVAAGNDPKVNFTRSGQFTPDVPKLEQLLVEFISHATGGPLQYTGRDMATVHTGMSITDAEFDAMVVHLYNSLQKHQVPQKEIGELFGIVAGTKQDIVGK